MTEVRYPDVTAHIVGGDGNVYTLITKTRRALLDAGHRQAAEEFTEAAFNSASYDAVLSLIQQTVTITSVDDDPDNNNEEETP